MQSKSLEGLQVRRVPTSADLPHPGEYVFIEKRAAADYERTLLYHVHNKSFVVTGRQCFAKLKGVVWAMSHHC
jgi:hypothetical protein